MKRLGFRSIAATAVVACLTVPLFGRCDRQAIAVPRNLILISIDTLRADRLGAYGYDLPISPGLDGYAARGALFRNTISSSSWTVPAHMTVFTGLEPQAHGLLEFPEAGRLGDDHVPLARLLRDNGFRTAAFVGGGFISPRHGFEIGFDRFITRGRRFETMTEEAKRWVDSVPAEERFFLFFHGFNVHRPYRPPRPFSERFAPGDARHPDRSIADRLYPLLEDLAVLYDHHDGDLATLRTRPSESELELLASQYDGEVAYVDDLLTRFLDELESRGRLEETLVVIISDHGDELYEHGSVDHVHTLYDELIRVPWIMTGPGVPARVIDRQVGLIDVMPTLCELLAVDVPTPVQGTSRAGELRSAPDRRSVDDGAADLAFSFTAFYGLPYRIGSVRSASWKLVLWQLDGMRAVDLDQLDFHHTMQMRTETEDFFELFDLRNDAGERRNVAADHPDVVRRLAAALRTRTEESRKLARTPGVMPEPTPEYLEQLRSLGYLE